MLSRAPRQGFFDIGVCASLNLITILLGYAQGAECKKVRTQNITKDSEVLQAYAAV